MSISEPMAKPEPARRIEVFTGAGRRRSWSAAEKAAIVAESYASSETVCGVARRHGLTPQQLFTWRRLARRSPSGAEQEAALFVPAVVEEPPLMPASRPARRHRRSDSSAGAIELEIDGVVVRVGSEASPKAIAAVIRALKAGA